MSEVTRRGVLRAGVWGAPVVAVAVAAPAAAASALAPTMRITTIVDLRYNTYHDLYLQVDNLPPGSDPRGTLSWTPSGGRVFGSNLFFLSSDGMGIIGLEQFPTGVPYTFTAVLPIGDLTLVATYTYTFSHAETANETAPE
ncbi:hypothetical protein SCB71_14285 [Herbiconiux sp. KACC 21604]|uniref:hypothetical protein n=1 Tax=unclassified Herbiconiux TaxID=2618217 RepID=UPI001492183D|nr:hypothetical protein [Herbiconiux sp. SALV-R1]QJU54310.1 hypothetical protein HL652_12225 [Herbiconiux sp. SALV-R1]WPO85380.1 hypothetical protein SCB71_14285 [Herbiconiux sp. KACC 21604]